MKNIIFFFIFSLLCLVTPASSFAQNAPANSFGCYWDTTEVIDRCKLQINCNQGGFPAQGSYCVGLPKEVCESQPSYSCTNTSCGGINQPCCSTGSACNTGLGCTTPGSICSPNACGLRDGSPCCNATIRCSGSNLDCDVRTQQCRTKNCGGPGQACCSWRINPCDNANDYYCNNTNDVSKGTCVKRDANNCGGFNQPCCPGRTCPGNSALSCDQLGYCKSNSGCGATLGANCCPGQTCFRGLRCGFANQCMTGQCGDIGKVCCNEDQVKGGCWWGDCSGGVCSEQSNQPNENQKQSFPLGCAGNQNGIPTAIGCIPVGSGSEIVIFLIKWGTAVAGGIALLLFIYSGFLIMTSQGDPSRLQSGRELLLSAVTGVLLMIFSIFVLRLLGVNILGLF